MVRGYLGVGIQDVTPVLAEKFNLPAGHGALVADVMPRSPADKAGLQSGDVIVDFNHKPIADSRHLKLQVAVIRSRQQRAGLKSCATAMPKP